MRPRGKYWYLIVYAECPVCGRDYSYRERQYTPRPEDPQQRHRYEVHYDWCDVL